MCHCQTRLMLRELPPITCGEQQPNLGSSSSRFFFIFILGGGNPGGSCTDRVTSTASAGCGHAQSPAAAGTEQARSTQVAINEGKWQHGGAQPRAGSAAAWGAPLPPGPPSRSQPHAKAALVYFSFATTPMQKAHFFLRPMQKSVFFSCNHPHAKITFFFFDHPHAKSTVTW